MATITPTYSIKAGDPYDPILINAIFNALVISAIIGADIATGAVDSTQIADAAITSDKIIADAIISSKIAADAINATHIASNTISADDIQSDAVTTTKLLAGAITADKIAALAITTAKLEAESVTTPKIAADAIDASKIAANAIETDGINADAITAVKIASSAVTTNKLYAGAVTSDKISVAELAAISAALGEVTSGTVTAGIIRTSANPAISRVLIDSDGLIGYDATLGQTFKLPTDGSAPVFASGQIMSATIIDTTIVSNDFKTSSELPWVEMTDSGFAYRENAQGGLYGTALYGTDTYGSGVAGYVGKSDQPFVSIEQDRAYSDVRFYNRSGHSSGASAVGDVECVSDKLYLCTTAGTPGTFIELTLGDATAKANVALDNLASVAINTALLSDTDNTDDLGSAAKEWKDLYIDGTANIDSLVADTADINAGTWQGTIDGNWTAAGQTCADLGTVTTCNIDGGTVDGTNVGATTSGTGVFTTLSAKAASSALISILDATKTAANAVVLSLRSNEAANYFAAGFSIIGAAAQADRYLKIQTSEVGVANAGNIVLQYNGGNVGIGTVAPGGKLCINGGLTIGSDTDAGDNNLRVEGTMNLIGGQIAFPASQSASADPNTIDDYEEGTWDAGISFSGGTTGVAYVVQDGSYLKVGNRVFLSGYFVLSSKGTSEGDVYLTGLPFTVKNADQGRSAGSVHPANITYSGMITAAAVKNNTIIVLFQLTEAGALTILQDTDCANNSSMIMGVSYEVE